MPTNGAVMGKQFRLKVGGSPLSDELERQLDDVEVTQTVGRPAQVTIRFKVDGNGGGVAGAADQLLDDLLVSGPELEISSRAGRSQKVLFLGDVVSVGLDLDTSESRNRALVIVKGLDRSSRLMNAGLRSRTFSSMTFAEIASLIAGEVGLVAAVDATSELCELVTQLNQTDWDFLAELANRVGYAIYVEADTLHFEKAGRGRPVKLAWGSGLIGFQPEVSLAEQGTKVSVRGWDPLKKEAIVGTSTTGASGGQGSELALNVVDMPVRTSSEADLMAEAIAGNVARGSSNARGIVKPGVGSVTPATVVRVSGLGDRFNGNYTVTSATHHFSAGGGYVTTFEVGGTTYADRGLSRAEARAFPMDALGAGVVVGIVTNNHDPEDLGRVKVAFPWLDSNPIVSTWARVATLMAGNERGTYFVPEIDDEVLVAFDHADFGYPVVVGALWNGSDRPPASNANGENNFRSITSRSGHVIRFDDAEGEEKIEIRDAADRNRVVIDTSSDSITVDAAGDVNILGGQGTVTVAGHDIAIQSSGDLKMSAANVIEMVAGTDLRLMANRDAALESAVRLDVKAGGSVAVEGLAEAVVRAGAEAKLEGALATLEGTAIATVKGGLVQIN